MSKNIYRALPEFKKLLKDRNLSKKVLVYPSTKTPGDWYDGFEKNFTFTNLNPITVKALVRDISGEVASYKLYGQNKTDTKEILCEEKWINLFRIANKIEIDDEEYEVLKDAGKKLNITKRPFRTIRIVIQRKE